MLVSKAKQLVKVGAVAALCLGLGLALGAAEKSAEKKGDNEAPKITAEEKAMQDIAMAYHLIAYGREKKQPEALVLAARILSTTKGKEVKEPNAGKDAPEGEKLDKLLVQDLNKLLDEAKSLAPSDKKLAGPVLAMINRTREDLEGGKTRAVAVNGVQSWGGLVAVGQTQVFSRTFNGKAKAIVNVQVLTAPDANHYLRATLKNSKGTIVALDQGANVSLQYTNSGATALFTLEILNTYGNQPATYLTTTNALK